MRPFLWFVLMFFHVCWCFFTLYILICWSGSDCAAFNRCTLLEWRVLYGNTAHAKYGGNMESHGAPLSLIIGQPQPGAAGRAHCFGAQMSGECGTAMDTADWFVQLPWDDLFPTCQRVSRFYQRCICIMSEYMSDRKSDGGDHAKKVVINVMLCCLIMSNQMFRIVQGWTPQTVD